MDEQPDLLPRAGELPWIVADLRRRVAKLEAYEPAVMQERLTNLATKMDDLIETVEAGRKALINFSLTIAASTLVGAFTILLAVGKI